MLSQFVSCSAVLAHKLLSIYCFLQFLCFRALCLIVDLVDRLSQVYAQSLKKKETDLQGTQCQMPHSFYYPPKGKQIILTITASVANKLHEVTTSLPKVFSFSFVIHMLTCAALFASDSNSVNLECVVSK